MRVHVQYARYIKRFELFPSWMLNPVLNQFKIIIFYFYALHAVLSFVAA